MKYKAWVVAVMMAVTVGGSALTLATPFTSLAKGATCGSAGKLLTFPVWYRGLNVSTSDCGIVSPDAVGGISVFIWTIVLNVLDIALQLVGYLSVGFIIYGGFKFMLAQGAADEIVKARTTILNAVIGLGLSMASVAIVNLIAGWIK